jgi:DNA repair protein RadC
MESSRSQKEGHRKRLRDRFLKGGRGAFPDYELLELLLTYVIPRRDTKPIAKDLLRRYRSFNSVLNQPKDKLEEIERIGPQASIFLMVIRACIERYLEQRVERRKSISSPKDVLQFVRAQLAAKQRECLLALYLNDSNRVLHHSIITEGTVNRIPLYPREILRQGLACNATGLILVHNHPEGQPVPSDHDLEMTRKLEEIAAQIDIRLLDHLVVTGLEAYSIKTGKLL